MKTTCVVLLALTAAVLVGGCGGGGSAGPATTATTPEPPEAGAPPNALPVNTSATSTTAKPPAPPKPAAGLRVRLTMKDGKPVGGRKRWSVEKGKRVTIIVRSDRADEVHVHGYDLDRAIVPGKVATLAFTATIAGRFEIESHESGLAIATLEVRA